MIHEAKVHAIKDIDSLITFLKEDLNWQLPAGDLGDITFDWTGTELNLSESSLKKLKGGCIRQLQNFRQDQPWGIFIVDFAADKLLVSPVRDMLRSLVSKKRGQSPEHTSWDLPNLLFICLFGKDGFSFAHFKGDKPYGSPLTTFSWHPGDPIHTVCEYNLPALEYDDKWKKDIWVTEWQKAFDVEAVNKLFYREIAELYYRLTGKNKHPRELIFPSQGDQATDKDHEEFAVRLIGRTIFCWFLKHKKSPPPASQPLIPPEVLSLKAVKQNPDYYHSVLEPLFFEVMNKEIAARPALTLQKSETIPFLNGGLFESHPNDFYKGTPTYSLKVPDAWFVDFFTVLGKYNFTIDENSSININVSVDPEMLGRVFENLLAEIVPETGEAARKATGSYYTPRVIVDYMVEQSLKQYLLTKTTLGEEKITALLAYGEETTGFTPTDRLAVVQALTEIKIIDPACGSGAFPIGVLHRMLMVLEKVDPKLELWQQHYLAGLDPMVRQSVEKNIKKNNWAYIRKLMIIRDAIYGVDIQPIAVEIAKLRCFLSLVVDEIVTDSADNRGIESLPNLEFKFVAANSLIGLPPKIERQGKFGISEHIKTLKILRDEFLRSSGQEKKEVEKKFRQTQKKLQEENAWLLTDGEAKLLAEWDPFSYQSSAWFDPEWMFGVDDKFDIVIANPPYIRQESLDNKDYYAKHYASYHGMADIYIYFIEHGFNILRENGTLSYITSNRFSHTNYGEKLRLFLSKKALTQIVNLNGTTVFENANVDTLIMFVQNGITKDKQFKISNIDITERIDNNFGNLINNNSINVSSKYFDKRNWSFYPDQVLAVKRKIDEKGTALIDVEGININRGITTGLNEVFVIDQKTRDKLVNEDAHCGHVIRPILKGAHIKRWWLNWSNSYLIYTFTGIDISKYPSIYKYLYQYKDELSKVYEAKEGKKKWCVFRSKKATLSEQTGHPFGPNRPPP